MHLTLRVGEIEKIDALQGREQITRLLQTMVSDVGMRVLAGPMVAEEQGIPERQGWSGVVILYESHAAIHTYPLQKEAFLDIFSCRPFEVAVIAATLERFLGRFTVLEEDMHDRGHHWGENVKDELDTWRTRRTDPALAGSK